MKVLRSSLVLAVATFMPVSAVQAHPGHDGHELTWDLSHLVSHPVATGGCLAIGGLLAWCAWWGLRKTAMLRGQSFRGSQASRGK